MSMNLRAWCRRWLVLLVLTGLEAVACGAPLTAAIEHLEPPSWWIGMQDDRVQLMVHGPGLGEFMPETDDPGLTIESVTRVANPNFLFVQVRLLPAARPGMVRLVFRRGQQTIRHDWPLRAREPGSALRRGFDASDVILNLVPDRFANSDQGNDRLPGYDDRVDRSDDSTARHGGDLRGIVEHLDYIAGMGFTMLWPTPLLENRQERYSYHGYAITDSYRIDPRFGSNEDYVALSLAARARGIGLIQDVVLNHIGSGHWWMKDLPTPDWVTFGGKVVPTQHFRTAVADPYADAADRLNFTAGWFDAQMPDMNQRNPLVATYQIQNTLWWIESAGLSGLRIDTYGYNDKAFLSAWSRRVMREYPNLNLVGEEWSANPVVIAQWLRGRPDADGLPSALPSVMDFPMHETLRRALLAPESLHQGFSELYASMVNDLLYPEPMKLVTFEGNHDVPRLFSVLNEDPSLFRMALVHLLTMRGIPQLYYGTELLMTSPRTRDDGATRRDFPGGWPGDAVNAFTGQGLTPAQREAQAFVRRLLTWRRSQPAVHFGRLHHYTPDRGTYTWFRHAGAAKVMVVLNKNSEAVELETRRFSEMLAPDARGTDVLTAESLDLSTRLTVPARGVRILEIR